jgi:hypothetical protein
MVGKPAVRNNHRADKDSGAADAIRLGGAHGGGGNGPDPSISKILLRLPQSLRQFLFGSDPQRPETRNACPMESRSDDGTACTENISGSGSNSLTFCRVKRGFHRGLV